MDLIDIESIYENSQRGYAICPLDGLLNEHWCEEEDLMLAGSLLSKDESIDNVVAFFQLPYRIKLPEKWIRLPKTKGNPYIYFRTTGTALNTLEKRDGNAPIRLDKGSRTDGLIKSWNAELKPDLFGLYIRTQVLISVELWDDWGKVYQEYLKCIQKNPKQLLGEGNLRTEANQIPWNAEIYETELTKRIQKICIGELNNMIPAYRIACRDSLVKEINNIECFFWMNKTGRIIKTVQETSEIKRKLSQFQTKQIEGNLKKFQNRLKKKNVNYIYEEYILDALRQIDIGFPALAVVQIIIVLEWFVNEIIHEKFTKGMKVLSENVKFHDFIYERMWQKDGRSPKGRGFVRTEEKFNEYLPALGIKMYSKTANDLQKLIRKRNDIVHHIAKTDITSSEAHDAVNIGLQVIEEIMDQIVNMNT